MAGLMVEGMKTVNTSRVEPVYKAAPQTAPSIFGRRVIPSMALAPSAHNTQPWRFIATNNQIDVFIDYSRHLTISDPTQRQLFISLGCAIENGVIAAKHWAYDVEVTYFPEGEGKDKPVARLKGLEGQADDAHVDELFSAIADRRTNRHFYDAKPLASSERASLDSRQDDDVIFIEDEVRLQKIADISAQATEKTLSRRDFKSELAQWVRNNWTSRHDGMPGYAMIMPAPLSLISSFMVRVAPIHKQEAPKTKQQVTSASAVAVIATPGDTTTDWLDAGRTLERLWLEATVAGLAAMPVVAAIEAGDDFRQQLQDAVSTNRHAQSMIRIGHNDKGILQATPRRQLEDCATC